MLLDYARRILIVILLALCVSIMFLTGKEVKAMGNEKDGQWVFPVEGVITDVYGTRSGTHKGMDIGGDIGSPVYAAADGVVSKSYYSESYGHVVFVSHGNGYETVYAHLQDRGVSENQHVLKGEQIGSVGNTGRSTGAHLHFEVHKGEWTLDKLNAIDPFELFGEGEVGQLVFAKEQDPYQTIEVSSNLTQLPVHRTDQKWNDVTEPHVIHTVKKNETLWGISKQYGLSVEEVKEWNDIQSSHLKIYQKLIIPRQLNDDRYIVKQGDTLHSIAKKHGIDLTELLGLNDLTMSDVIYPHQKLKIRKER
ncbi:peptidoglycan DD-metalloendopeptidase family protein [Rossellomorea oryzaecorticis]|uniref:Peptidoglycan DD-metalloendopeptidase family protein n=1 Tax=Rossellomorea oryzaecorticis TaxID=1396505 RepID=A0ABU9KFF4_9BACI